MEELPHLVTDLAYILIVASAVTIIFKRLKQPLVLGYIVAGFLAGPYMTYTPSISDHASIEDWSQIGVIFLMFSLGLEFSFKKVIRLGFKPIAAAIMVMLCMMSVGSTIGYLMGWDNMNRMFLGGMLAMSSTTIIYKAYDDMGLRSQKFAGGVLSVLILEDILGILLMVVLSAMAVSRKFEGEKLMESLLQLGFFLVLWFLVGVFMVPSILRKFKPYINNETLLIVSVGLCFMLVVAAGSVGYSPAFGAFMMGSILAETVEAEHIESVVNSLKDLFGAIFFVSVGMLVDPAILLNYWPAILAITCAVVMGQMVFGTLSFVLSGHKLDDAIRSGFSLVQIGEFAFIIAALGENLHVTDKFLYPVVVAVSIITTFLTPYLIRLGGILAGKAVGHSMLFRSASQSQGKSKTNQSTHRIYISPFTNLLKDVFIQTVAYCIISSAIILTSFSLLLPLSRKLLTHWPGNAFCGIVTLILISPLVRAVVMRKNNSHEAQILRSRGMACRMALFMTLAAKVYIGGTLIYYILNFLSPYWWVWHVLVTAMLIVIIVLNKRVKLISIRMERTFRQNLGRREMMQRRSSYAQKLRGSDLQIATIEIPQKTKWGGKTLSQLHFGKTHHTHIAAIIRGSQRINIPGANNRIYPGDKVEIVSDSQGIENFRNRAQADVWTQADEKQFQDRLHLISLHLHSSSPICGKTLQEIDFRTRYHCMVVGAEEKDGTLQMIGAQTRLEADTILWVVGEDADLKVLIHNS